MDKVTRIGVSLEPELLEAFDELIQREGYGSRSEAIRDVLRKQLSMVEEDDPDADVVATITFIYDHHKREVTNKLISLQHDCNLDIRATTHVHITHELCMEVIIVTGNAKDVRTLGDGVKSLKGVLYAETVLASLEL